ncbi:hypothetical protein PSAB6_620004 [Paraburkholderia sabiae]|nr:hypothetical protein PSAB6_620004 [Paraburkholderia sabiae]
MLRSSFLSATLVAVLGFLFFAARASAISFWFISVAPVRGGTYFSLQRQRKVGKRKPLLYLRCPPG